MVMTNLPENLWKANPLESFKNGSTMKTEVDHVYGTLSKLEHIGNFKNIFIDKSYISA